MTTEQILQQFGLTEKQARVYLALLELGEARIGPLASRSGIKRTSIYNFIGELVNLGIITKFNKNNRDHYRAENPNKLLALYQMREKQLKDQLPELETLYQAAGVIPTRVSYFRDANELKQLLYQPLHNKVKQIDWLWAREVMKKVFPQNILDDFKARREQAKIFSRIIQPRLPDSPPIDVVRDKSKYRERRFAPNGVVYNASIMLFGDKISFISSRQENFGVLIESTEFTNSCRVLFEGFWSISEPQ